jgi:uncharacterized membrane protein YedE/YeeE
MALLYVLLGTMFGFILSRSGAADYNYIQAMFLFTNFQLYGIIGTAVAITAPGIWLIKRYGRTALGRPIAIELKPRHRGNIVGGLLFGIGWSMAGMCPGPIFVNVGEGKIYALAALAGALAGAGLFGAVYTRIQSVFRLPRLLVGTGDG